LNKTGRKLKEEVIGNPDARGINASLASFLTYIM
jgi:hypothetical protein